MFGMPNHEDPTVVSMIGHLLATVFVEKLILGVPPYTDSVHKLPPPQCLEWLSRGSRFRSSVAQPCLLGPTQNTEPIYVTLHRY